MPYPIPVCRPRVAAAAAVCERLYGGQVQVITRNIIDDGLASEQNSNSQDLLYFRRGPPR